MKIVYYYKDEGGLWHFSDGEVLTDANARWHLMELKGKRKRTVALYPDNPEDYKTICRKFGFAPDIPWQAIYKGQ